MMSLLSRSWSLSIVLKHAAYMSLPSAIRYRNLLVREARGAASPEKVIRLRMRRPFPGDVWLREAGSDRSTFREVVLVGIYEALARGLRDCEYVMDLGANIGLASRFFAAAFPPCKIFAVEPDAQNFALLERNLSWLGSQGRSQVFRAAVWDRDEAVSLGLPPQGLNFDAIRVAGASASGRGTSVPGQTMATLMERSGFPRVDLLKVDVEGAEVEMFRGDLSWLERVRAIAIEFHQDSRERSGFDCIMQRFGFRLDNSHPHTVTAFRC
jgi:FkbM family methyltransferase